MSILTKTEHPHVGRDGKGRPVVGKAGLEVHILARWSQLGCTVDELAESYPFLSRGEILDALSYYHDHEAEVDTLIKANSPPDEWPACRATHETVSRSGCPRPTRRHAAFRICGRGNYAGSPQARSRGRGPTNLRRVSRPGHPHP